MNWDFIIIGIYFFSLFQKEANGESSPGQFQRSQSLNVNAAEYTPEKALPNLLQAPPPVQQQQLPKRSMSWKEEMVIRNADSGKGDYLFSFLAGVG